MTTYALDLYDAPPELDAWYVRERLAAFTRAGFSRVTRWASPSPKQPRSLAVYEHAREGATFPALPTEGGFASSLAGVFRPTGALALGRIDRESGGLLVGLTDVDDLAREAEFERFYDEVHAAEVIASGLYVSALRLRAVEALPSHPRFAALYPSAGDGHATFRAFLAAGGATPVPPCFLVRRVMTFARVDR